MSDLQDIVNWDGKWHVDFNAGKTQLIPFHQWKNSDAIDMKMDESALDKRSSFTMLRLSFSSELDYSFHIASIAKSTSKKVEALIHSIKFFLYGCSLSQTYHMDFFFYIYNLHVLKQKVYSHQVLIYLNLTGIPAKKPLKIVYRTTGCVKFRGDLCKLFDWETFINKQKG